MAKIYYRQILSGKITIKDVPDRWRKEVEQLLNQ